MPCYHFLIVVKVVLQERRQVLSCSCMLRVGGSGYGVGYTNHASEKLCFSKAECKLSCRHRFTISQLSRAMPFQDWCTKPPAAAHAVVPWPVQTVI